MYLKNSSLKSEIKKVHQLQNGTIYVFEDFLVSEFKEGAVIGFDNFVEIYHYLNSYGQDKKLKRDEIHLNLKNKSIIVRLSYVNL